MIEKVYTGQVPSKNVEPGTAVEIATGAPMPQGADAVVMVEETEKAGSDVRVLTPVYPRQNVGGQGADIVVGQTVIARGDVLNPSKVMAHCPPILRAAKLLGASIAQSGTLPKGLASLVSLRVAAINGCPF